MTLDFNGYRNGKPATPEDLLELEAKLEADDRTGRGSLMQINATLAQALRWAARQLGEYHAALTRMQARETALLLTEREIKAGRNAEAVELTARATGFRFGRYVATRVVPAMHGKPEVWRVRDSEGLDLSVSMIEDHTRDEAIALARELERQRVEREEPAQP